MGLDLFGQVWTGLDKFGGWGVGWYDGLAKNPKNPGNVYRKSGKFKLHIFQDHSIMGPSKPVSQKVSKPAYNLAI